MDSFYLKIADVVLEINHRYPYIEMLSKEYIMEETPGRPDLSISVPEEDLQHAYEKCNGANSMGYLEGILLLQKAAYELIPHDVFWMHAAAVAVDGQAYLFSADSGVGKSTHVMQWMKHFKDEAVIVNGDKPFIAFRKEPETGRERLYVYGCPWRGKEKYGANISMPVAGICFLERDETNEIRPASSAESIPRMFRQMIVPSDSAKQTATMAFCNRLLHEVPCYILKCNISEDAAVTAYEGMKPR